MLTVPPAAVQLQASPQAENHTNGVATPRLDGLSDEAACQLMIELPEPTHDPFSSLQDRLTETLNLFRYTASPASLIDWAAIQSGLADPLTRFTRQKLEQIFPRFERNREEHLKQLLAEARQRPTENLQLVVKSAPPAAQRAVSKYIKAR